MCRLLPMHKPLRIRSPYYRRITLIYRSCTTNSSTPPATSLRQSRRFQRRPSANHVISPFSHISHMSSLTRSPANFTAFEIDDEVLSNLREYALANSIYWVSRPAFQKRASTNPLTHPSLRLSQKATLANSLPDATPWT